MSIKFGSFQYGNNNDADQVVNNSAVLVDMVGSFIPVNAGENFRFSIRAVIQDTSAAGNIALSFIRPDSCNGGYYNVKVYNAFGNNIEFQLFEALPQAAAAGFSAGPTNFSIVEIDGYVLEPTGAANLLGIQFAQTAANPAADTTALAYSVYTTKFSL